jgi:hypothetical protein
MKRFASQAFYMRPDDPPPATPPVITPTVEPPDVKRQRDHIAALEADLKTQKERAIAAEALITESERAKLADNERLTLELADERKKVADLNPLTERTTQLEAKFTKLYEERIATMPAEVQVKARELTEVVTSPEGKFDMLMKWESMLMPAVVPKAGGTPNGVPAPGTIPPTPQTPTVIDPSKWGEIDLQEQVIAVANDPARAATLQQNYPKPQS